jgi:hypothetical protein
MSEQGITEMFEEFTEKKKRDRKFAIKQQEKN